MIRTKSLSAASLALLFLAACGSVGGGLGDILGGGNQDNYEIRGTVDHVDRNSRSVYLTNVSGYSGSMLSSGGGGNSVRVYYDDQTPVSFQGQTYRVEDLERGDVVTMRVDDNGNQLVAESVTVNHDVSGGSSYPSGGVHDSTNLSTIRGTVTYVDTSRRTIELESASWRSGFNTGMNTGSRIVVSYDANTSVDVSGRLHPVSGLERGDVIEVQVSNPNSSTPFAQRIWLVRDVRQ